MSKDRLLSSFLQAVAGILAHGFQEPEACVPTRRLGYYERLVHQREELVKYLRAINAVATTYSLRRLNSPAAREHRQALQQSLFRLAQQLITPVHRCLERLLAGQGSVAAARQQTETILQPRDDLL